MTNEKHIRQGSLLDLDSKPSTYLHEDRPEMVKYISPTARRILDVGCASGGFGQNLKFTSGAEVWGIEIDAVAADIAHTRLFRVINDDVSLAVNRLPKGYFDCVVCNDILEHLADPYSVLLHLKDCLAPSGSIVCSVPNVRFYSVLYRLLVEKNWRYSDSGVMDKTHLRFFTIKSLAVSFEQAGYEVVRIEGINPSSKSAAWALRIASIGWLSDCIYPQIACVAHPR